MIPSISREDSSGVATLNFRPLMRPRHTSLFTSRTLTFVDSSSRLSSSFVLSKRGCLTISWLSFSLIPPILLSLSVLSGHPRFTSIYAMACKHTDDPSTPPALTASSSCSSNRSQTYHARDLLSRSIVKTAPNASTVLISPVA